MSAVDEIQAAIDKLMGIQRGLGSDWRLTDELTIEFDHPDGETYEVLTSDYEGIPAGILTLHATIDAQLAILDGALEAAESGGRSYPEYSGDRRDFALARAINGGTN